MQKRINTILVTDKLENFLTCLIVEFVFTIQHNNPQEFFAYGLMNLVGSVFECFNSGLSVSRTIVYERTGAKTQVSFCPNFLNFKIIGFL